MKHDEPQKCSHVSFMWGCLKLVGPQNYLLSKNTILGLFGVPDLKTHHVFDVFLIVSAQSNLCLQISDQEPRCASATAYRMPDALRGVTQII